MASITDHSSVTGRLFPSLGAFFARVGEALYNGSNMSARARQIEALQSMTDAQLAEKGIKRDEIVHHVFRDIYYI